MNATNKAIDHHSLRTGTEAPRLSPPLSGKSLSIGKGFEAQSFRAKELEAAMDPLVMVDEYGTDALRFTLAAMAARRLSM